MKPANKLTFSIIFLIIIGVLSKILASCQKYDLISIENNMEFKNRLSEYHIYQEPLGDLIPFDNFKLYELATPLFSDYSQKQRLIKLPEGTYMKYLGNGLPEFPDGTILVKTFFYYNDQTDLSKGKKIIETRLLIKHASRWNVATYVWNEPQTEAFLQVNGSHQTVSWIDGNGKSRFINYRIPKNDECTTCHQSDYSTIPIGLKLRNLNIDIWRNGVYTNQLKYFQDASMINPFIVSSIAKLPNWESMNFTLAERARAYFDINCAHCHNSNGFAQPTKLYLDYESTFNNSKIRQHKPIIIKRMESTNNKKRMPKLGTTVIHEEGLALIKEYINSL